MKITFCGAARIVTGSCYLIEVDKKKYLVDCGMFQGTKDITRRNYEKFLFNPKQISAVFLTHAHIDHSGLLPKLRKEGFKGKVYTTPPTADLVRIMLEDSANIQMHDVEHENERRKRQNLPPRKPLYDDKDVSHVMELFRKVDYNENFKVSKEVSIRFRDAGHIIGSAIIEVFVTEGKKATKLVFSGDLGQWDVPIVKDPTLIEDADYVFLESTYGDRLHEDPIGRDKMLIKHINETYDKGGKLMIPSFAIERTQELLYSLNKIIRKGSFPEQKIYLDSPLAIKATEIFKKNKNYFDNEAMFKYKNPFNIPHLIYTLHARDSKAINGNDDPCVIIAGSGMCTAGRIRHHIKNYIEGKENKLLFVGYQAYGTLGRHILEGAKKIHMMGESLQVNAEIEKINGFSAHADYKELLKWMGGFLRRPDKVFIVHGEESASKSLNKKLKKMGFKCHVPVIGEKIEL